MTNEPLKATQPLPYECFQDRSYYDMWCVRRVNEREWGKSFHLVNGEEAAALRDLLNTRAVNSHHDLIEALRDVGASLAAAISLLERGGKAAKKAAPSDRMFDQMVKDYKASLNRTRAILTKDGRSMSHVPYPGCHCADCVEGAPSARITGDKDRENPVEGAPLKPCPVCGTAPKWRGSREDYRRGIYRLQCMGETHLFQSYGATEEICIAAWNERQETEANRRLAIECHRLRLVLRRIADTGYVDHQSGNQNFEHLQSIARDALTKAEAGHG